MFKLPFLSSVLFTSSSVAAATPVILENNVTLQSNKEISLLGKLSNIEYQEALIFEDSYKLFSKIALLSEAYSNLGDYLFQEIKKFSEISEEEQETVKAQILSIIKEKDISNKKNFASLISKISENFVSDANLKAVLKFYVENLSNSWNTDFSLLHSKYKFSEDLSE